jgi:hypothetical protein
MPLSFLKKLVRYRTITIAIANAAVTWAILIIAPLGLFAVITCTISVFISSLLIGNLSDRALLFLVAKGDRQNLDSNTTATLEANHHQEQSDSQNQRTGVPESSLIQQQIKKLLK